MARFVELSREISDGMGGINPRYAVRVRPFTSHAPDAASHPERASFEISEVSFQVPVGTYLDSPRTRDPGGRDIAALGIEELVSPGVYVDLRGHGGRAHAPVLPEHLPPPNQLKGCALLLDFGRAESYGAPRYDETPPHLPKVTVEALIAAGVRLLGVDSRSPDDGRDATKPAHTLLLRANTFIVENLINLDLLRGQRFRFFAVPLRVRDATSFPIRAFAEILD